jgi:hypothetical protein
VTTRQVVETVWAALAVMVVSCQVVAVVTRGRLPGLGTVVTRLSSHPMGRGAAVLVWMWLGWHAFAR